MRYLSSEENQSIRRLREAGESVKNIQRMYGISEATVYNVASGKTKPRSHWYKGKQVEHPDPEPPDEDFSQYPDTVLFKHVRSAAFIG
jgi:hypothetical protein